ncbi:MAG: DUF3148 domain-containing protein [Cyanobacteria bacterium J06627_8]
MVDDHTPEHSESVEESLETASPAEQMGLSVGDRVRVVELPPFVKSADPMPMLRPPDVIRLNEEGTVLERRSGDNWSVRFERGVFLMDERFLEAAE